MNTFVGIFTDQGALAAGAWTRFADSITTLSNNSCAPVVKVGEGAGVAAGAGAGAVAELSEGVLFPNIEKSISLSLGK